MRQLVVAEPPLWVRNAGELRMTGGMLGYAWHSLFGRRRAAVASFLRAVTRYRDGGNGFDAMTPARRERALGHADDVAAELRIGTGEDLTPPLLRRISCPTTLLLGERSARLFARQGAKLAAAMPQLRTVTIAGAGHLMMLEQPSAFADAIIAADTAPTWR